MSGFGHNSANSGTDGSSVLASRWQTRGLCVAAHTWVRGWRGDKGGLAPYNAP